MHGPHGHRPPPNAIVRRPGFALLSVETEALVERCLIGIGFVVLFALMPHAVRYDDTVRFADIESLLHHGHLTSSRFSLVMPLVSSPFLLLGEVVKSPAWWAGRFNVLVVAAGSVVIWRLLRPTVDARLLRKVLLVLLFASLLTNELRYYDAEVFTATLVAIGIVTLVTGRQRRLGWAALVVGVVNTPAAIVGLCLLAAGEAVRTRRRRYLVPALAAVVLIMLEAWLRRGGPLVTGYEGNHGFTTVLPYSGRSGFSYPFLFGLAAILFSFGRGLFFFMPGLLFWANKLERRALANGRRMVGLMLLFTAGLVLVYAKWWAWYGGIAWGPRFFTFAALPASVLLGVRLRRVSRSAAADVVTLAVLTLSAWVGFIGAISPGEAIGTCAANRFALESLCWYSPEFSALGYPFVHFPAVTWSSGLAGGFCVLVYVYLAAPLVLALLEHLAAARQRLSLAGWEF